MIWEDRELLAELTRLNTRYGALAMRIIDGMACVHRGSQQAGQASDNQAGVRPRLEVVQPALDALPNEECDQAWRQGEGSTMSEIRTLVDSVTAAWNNHDAAAFAAQFSEDSVLRIIATGDVLHRREQLRAVAEAYLHAFPNLRIERRNTYECGDAICIIESTLTATHQGEFMGIPPTHRSVELLICSIFTLGADQHLGEEVVYFDAATLLRQLGVLPEPADAQPS